MKVLLKKFTVLAAAFAMHFAVSACKDPNGKANRQSCTSITRNTAPKAIDMIILNIL